MYVSVTVGLGDCNYEDRHRYTYLCVPRDVLISPLAQPSLTNLPQANH